MLLRLRFWLICGLLLLVSGCTLLGLDEPDFDPAQQYRIGAYYSLEAPEMFQENHLRQQLVPAQLPTLGHYSSWDVAVAEQHISWASEFGVDFFAFHYDPARGATDSRYELFLMAPNINDIEFCLFYRGENSTTLAADLEGVAQRFFAHPRYLRHRGRPVLILSLASKVDGAAVEAARESLKTLGFNPFLIVDGLSWSEPAPAGYLPRHPGLRSELFDGVTGYQMFEEFPPSQHGYGFKSTILSDLRDCASSFRSSDSGRCMFIPSVLTGYNRRVDDKKSPVVARKWRPTGVHGSLLRGQLDAYALERVDKRLPMVLIRSWNEWLNDSAIEPLALASPTLEDSSGEQLYTAGFPYAGYELGVLEGLQEETVAASGLVKSKDGKPLAGVAVSAWKGRELIATGRSDGQGHFRLSRWSLKPGVYRVGLTRVEGLELRIKPHATARGLVFISEQPPEPREESLELEPKLGLLAKDMESFVADFATDQEPVEVAGLRLYPSSQTGAPGMEKFESFLEEGANVLVIDGKSASLPLRLAKNVGSSGMVYACESRPHRYRELVHNLRLNEGLKLRPLPYAVGAQAGVIEVADKLTERRTLDSFHWQKLAVALLLEPNSVAETLQGAKQTLLRRRPVVVWSGPQDPENEERIAGLLATCGYRKEQLEEELFVGFPILEAPDRRWLSVGSRGSSECLAAGFSPPEPDPQGRCYAWSDQAESELLLHLAQPAQTTYRLGLRAMALKSLGPVAVELFVNEARVGLLKVSPEWSTEEIEVPAEVLRTGDNRVKLRYQKTGRPSDTIAGSTDQRELAMALEAVWLLPAALP